MRLVVKLISESFMELGSPKVASAQENFNLSSKICQPWPTKLYQKERKKLTNTFATSELQEKKSCCITCFFFCFKVSSQLSLSQASTNLEKSIEVDAEIYKFSILQLHFHIEKVKERKIEVRSENFFFLFELRKMWRLDFSIFHGNLSAFVGFPIQNREKNESCTIPYRYFKIPETLFALISRLKLISLPSCHF